MNFTTIQSEGLLLSYDLLTKIASGEAPGQKPSDFGLDGRVRLSDEIAACWSETRDYWKAFQHSVQRLDPEETGATATREQWILPLLRSLGFDHITFMKSAARIGERTYAISHRLGDSEEGLPIHIEGARIDLDSRPPTGVPRISPHALLQEYLNRTEHLWAIVTNGCQFRILRQSSRLTRPTYLEVDLKQMMEGEQFAEFQVLYRIIHRSRWPVSLEKSAECWLEKYYLQSIEEGGRVRDKLRDGVEQALRILGQGFMNHPQNQTLRDKIKAKSVTPMEYYQQLLRLVYRFLFLMVSEERNLAGPDPQKEQYRKIYDEHYSIRRLLDKVYRPINPLDRFWDVWEGVKQTFRFYSSPSSAAKIGMGALNGDLFGPQALPDLENAFLLNQDLLHGFAFLSLSKDNAITRPINYRYLDVEELGSVYESLLDFQPIFYVDNDHIRFDLKFLGTERKSTGSYYTRPELVQELIKSALVSVIEERLAGAKTKEEKVQALLNLKVCDPATGSGHFLLAAARRIGRELAIVRTGEEQPAPTQFRLAVRDVIRHCIYGVDVNPLAVDLCKVALWLEGHYRDMPLTFLDHRIKCGNSLVGLDTLERLKEGIPDEAYDPVTGDDKTVARKIKAQAQKELRALASGQQLLPMDATNKLESDFQALAKEVHNLEVVDEIDVSDIQKKQQEYEAAHSGEAWYRDWTAANIWAAAFFYPLTKIDDPAIPTQRELIRFLNNTNSVDGRLVGQANALASRQRFFHWPLEFPDVFTAGGFDVVLGNPPWERIKLQEREFFASHDPQIAEAPNKAAREKLIRELKSTNPTLSQEFECAKHDAESQSRFVRASKRFPLTAVGDVNMYALFAEIALRSLSPRGQAGIIVPTGIATDDTTKTYFQHLLNCRSLISLFDFENRKGIFKDVEGNLRFCLITIGRKDIGKFTMSAQMDDVNDLTDDRRKYELSANDIKYLNPNTLNCPTFCTAKDSELVLRIQRRFPIFVNEGEHEYNPWETKFVSMFHMSNDSHRFRTKEELLSQGWEQHRNIFVKGNDILLPLYEAKLAGQYDHRSATFDGIPRADRFKMHAGTNNPTAQDLSNPEFVVIPRYWVSKDECVARVTLDKRWFIGFRNAISAVADSRSLIVSVIPFSGVGNSMPLIICDKSTQLCCVLVGMLNSIIVDYVLKQKTSGGNLNFYILKQLPILDPSAFTTEDISCISTRVLELIYTAHDLKAFAEDVGFKGEPFKWDEDRRALLKAELDAYYAHLYGLTRDELRYILDPQDIYGPDFPGETFRVLKEKELKEFGEYRTRRLVLEAWDRLFGGVKP